MKERLNRIRTSKKLWSEAMTIRKVLEDTSTVGRTGRATWVILKRIRDEAGFIVTDTAGYHKDLDSEKARVMIDVHGEGKGSYAPGIGSYGPDWQHNMTLQLYHHVVLWKCLFMCHLLPKKTF